jgi:predicted porin
MKKSLLALAAMGAFVGTAHAQSSVSVYGIMDTGYSQVKNKTAAQVETTTTGVGLLRGLATSRLGFRGTEDIGGGLTAGFQMEGGVDTTSGTAAFAFDRHQFLTLSSKSAGTLLIGRTDALVKTVFDAFDAGYSNNLIGAYDGMGTSATDLTTNNRQGQRDSVIRYTSPAMGGVNVLADFLQNNVGVVNAAGVSTGDTQTASGYSIALRYAQGPIAAQIAHRNAKTKNMATAAGTANLTGIGTLGAAAVVAAESDALNTSFGASYNFGPAMVMANYFDQADVNKLNNTEVKERAYAFGVRVPVTKTATLFASYTKGDSTSATNVTADFSGMQFGAVYDLSKRTSAYGIYGGAKKQQTGSGEAVGSGLAAGIRHTF